MKRFALLLIFGIAATTLLAQPSVHGPFSSEELPRFRALAPIDTHAHVFAAGPVVAMLQKLNLHILDILVVDDNSSDHRSLEDQRNKALNVVHASHAFAKLCTSFDPYSFNQPDYDQKTIQGLNNDFANGAIAVKIWKNVGMEIKDANGHYLMADNPIFAPIYKDIAAHNRTLVAHLADPDSGWQPPNPASPDYEYYRDHPTAYMYGKQGVPSKPEILRARDHILTENPNLRVVGAHLGSMESNLDDLGRHLDKYPNFAVDLAARMPYFEMQPRETMISFITKYQDRLIYGTDIDYSGGADEKIRGLESVYANDWRYFATSNTLDYKGKPVQGLDLPESILRKIYHDNAAKWFPGILDSVTQASDVAIAPSTTSTQFEVASVKENKSGGASTSNIPLDRSDTYAATGGSFRAIDEPFIAYLIFAYKVEISEFRGGLMRSLPSWAVKDRFDIIAKSASPDATKDDMRTMVQSLLADRFKLRVHRGEHEFPVLAMYPAKPGVLGPQLKTHDSSCASPLPSPDRSVATSDLLGRWPPLCGDGDEVRLSRHRMRDGGRAMTMDQIADWIGGAADLDLPIVNRSGLIGTYDFVLEFVPDKLDDAVPNAADNEASGPNFQEAAEDQLGMRLKKERALLPLFFVDHIEYPSAN